METITHLIDVFLHLDKHLAQVVQDFGGWTHAILFLIVFCETGLVVTPFLPGDSLLFAAGSIAAAGGLDVFLLSVLLFVAAVLGDAVNYSIGRKVGIRAFESRWLKREYLERTQRFYDRYGGKTIIIARFVPIVRTFAPFLAGVGEMRYSKFALFNVVGGFLWVFSLVFAGYAFSEIPFVKKNFGLVILAIIIISVLPAVFELIKARRDGNGGGQLQAERSRP